MRATLIIGTAVGLVTSCPALAQTAVTTESADTPSDGLADIIVTAQRQEENLQRAAVAVDVVQGAELLAAGVTQLDRLDQLSPALTTQNGGTGAILFIRGVGNFAVAANSDPAIAFSVDGVYNDRPSSTTGVFYDLERIEVLKGPQGTLYGRNATGGAINVIPARPRLGVFEGYGAASYGNYNTATVEGAVNVPIGDRGALRVSGNFAQHDGYLNDGTFAQDDASVRVQIKAELTPNFTVRVSGDYTHSGGPGFGSTSPGRYVYNTATASYSLVPSGLPLSEGFFTPPAQAFYTTARVAGRNITPLAPYPFQDNDFYGANAELTYETDIGTLTIIPGWRFASLNYLTGVVDYNNVEKDEQSSVEARFAGRRLGIFDYTIGAYYFDGTIRQRLALTLASALTFTNAAYDTQSTAVFGRLTAHLSDTLRVVGGARYTSDVKDFSAQSTSGVLICPNPAGCPNGVLFPLVRSTSDLPFNFPAASGVTLPQISGGVPTGLLIARTDGQSLGHRSTGRVTYRAAIEFDVAPRSMFYASYETGYRSGGFNSAVGFETFDPEYIDAITGGLKNRFFDNRLQLNIEGFYWTYRNQQVSHVGLDLTGRTANYTQNIGRSRIWGGEVEVQALITPTTLINADIQYLNAKYLSFAFQQAIPTPTAPPPLNGCDVAATAAPTVFNVNCDGRPAYNSPKWTLNLGAQQTVPLGAYKLVLSADTQYKSSRVVAFEYLPEQVVGATWLSNAQITFGAEDDKWSVSAFVHNLENRRVLRGMLIHPTANIAAAQVSEPRLYGVRGSIKF